MYSNDHFQSVKLGADLFLIEAVVADPKSFICFTSRGSFCYYKSGHNYYKSGQLLQIGAQQIFFIISKCFTADQWTGFYIMRTFRNIPNFRNGKFPLHIFLVFNRSGDICRL